MGFFFSLAIRKDGWMKEIKFQERRAEAEQSGGKGGSGGDNGMI